MSKFIAAMDHSGGSTGGVLERYGREYTEKNKMDRVHEMRLRMVNSPDFNDKNIWAAILYKDTVDRGMVNLLREKGIETFLKIDSGCKEDGTLKQFQVHQMCRSAAQTYGAPILGTKMRSIIKSVDMVDAVLKQQFVLARTIMEYELLPIIEPEVPIDHPDKELIEQELYERLWDYLNTLSGKCVLKLTPPEVPNTYHNLIGHNNVRKIVFLSGGYSTVEACNRLSLNDNVSASFSRALSESLKADQTDDEFNLTMLSNIKMITEACK